MSSNDPEQLQEKQDDEYWAKELAKVEAQVPWLGQLRQQREQLRAYETHNGSVPDYRINDILAVSLGYQPNYSPTVSSNLPKTPAMYNTSVQNCVFCSRQFPNQETLLTHMQVHFSQGVNNPYLINCPVPTLSIDLATTLPQESQPKSHTCTVCGKGMSSKSKLTAHHRIHTGSKPCKCTYCEKSFRTKGDLNTHIRTHTGEKPYSCTICSKAFSVRGNLNKHMLSHTGVKRFACRACDMRFGHKHVLTNHVRAVHTKESPFSCTRCGKRFQRKAYLSTHMEKCSD